MARPRKVTEAICPKCGLNFNAKFHRTYKGIGGDIKEQVQGVHKAPEIWIDESAQVICPGCNELFTSQAIKYFGILSPKGLKIFIGLFMAGFLAFAMFALVKSF
ncbi:MAG: hypothetical protein AB1427_21120 [Thermodesulfobacteriota bacterium]